MTTPVLYLAVPMPPRSDFDPIEGDPVRAMQIVHHQTETQSLPLGTWTHRRGAWWIRIESPVRMEVVDEPSRKVQHVDECNKQSTSGKCICPKGWGARA